MDGWQSEYIDFDLQKSADLNDNESKAIEQFMRHPYNIDEADIDSVKNGIGKVLLFARALIIVIKELGKKEEASLKDRRRERRARNGSIAVVIVISLLLIAPSTFSNDYYTVDPYDGTVFWVHTEWWGISKDYREIQWKRVSGYDYPEWMTCAEDGSWYPAINIQDSEWDYDYR